MQWWESGKVYLKIDGNVLPVEPGKGYDLSLSDYDRTEQTEAGTKVREVVRMDIPSISVSFDCDRSMLQEMRAYRKKPSITVDYFDPTVSDGTDLKQNMMYVTQYKETMLADTEDGGIWKVSFILEDLKDV